jgi:hypothetical protein
MTKAGLVRDGHFGGFETIEGPPPESACHPAQTDGVAPACAYGRSTASVSRSSLRLPARTQIAPSLLAGASGPLAKCAGSCEPRGMRPCPQGWRERVSCLGCRNVCRPGESGVRWGQDYRPQSCLRAREIAIPAALAPGGT